MAKEFLCSTCLHCPYLEKEDCIDACCSGYCPLKNDVDYSTAVYQEIKSQNGDF